MLLVAVQQSLCSSHIIGQLVSIDQGFHLCHPAGQIPEVSSEALQAGRDCNKDTEWMSMDDKNIYYCSLITKGDTKTASLFFFFRSIILDALCAVRADRGRCCP